MKKISKFSTMLVFTVITGSWSVLINADDARICADGMRSYLNVCPEDIKNNSRPNTPPSAPVVARPSKPFAGSDCNASRMPGSNRPVDCPPLPTITTPDVSDTGNLINGRYRDHGDGTVTDVVTNIRWQRCAEGETWNSNTRSCDGEAIAYTWDDLPEPNNGWRVPTIQELKTLVYCSNTGTFGDSMKLEKYCEGDYQRPTIDQEVFPSKLLWFWSSSTGSGAYDSDFAWYVNLYDGYAYYYYKNATDYVRLARFSSPLPSAPVVVRPIKPSASSDCNTSRMPGSSRPVDCPPLPTITTPDVSDTDKLIHGRYRDHGDGTVTDVVTNIRWQRCIVGETWNGNTRACDGKATAYTWHNLPEPNNGWHVPTVQELKTLVYCSNTGKFGDAMNLRESCRDDHQEPAIDKEAFPSKLKYYRFWSSSAYTNISNDGWNVDFGNGSADGSNKNNTNNVRLARAGQ